MFLPRRCPLCDEVGAAPCGACVEGLRHAGAMAPVAGLDGIGALFAYEGAVRSLLLALKYGNRRDAVPWLGAQLAARVGAPVDVVTWAPTSARRAGRRGYDQAELLARATARALHRPVRPLLRRHGSAHQTGLGARERRVGPSFGVGWRRVAGRVLLVDDVATTGATLGAAGRALRAAGATSVEGVVVAHTPRATHRSRVAEFSPRLAPTGGPECRSPSAAGKR